MVRTLSIAETRAAFSALVQDVERGEQIVITRRGRAVAMLVKPEEAMHVQRLREARSPDGLASLGGGWPGSDELVREIEATTRSGQPE